METVVDFIFLCSKITVDGDWHHKIKRHFLFGRKALTNIVSVLKTETSLCWQRFIGQSYVKVLIFPFSSVQSLSCVRLFVTPWITARKASLSITNTWSSPKIMCIQSVMPSSHCILCCPLLLLPLSLPASGSFPESQLFSWDGQSIGVSASASVLPMNTQDWSPLGWTGWISLQSKGLTRVFSSTTVQKHKFYVVQLSSQSNTHIHTWLLEKS